MREQHVVPAIFLTCSPRLYVLLRLFESAPPPFVAVVYRASSPTPCQLCDLPLLLPGSTSSMAAFATGIPLLPTASSSSSSTPVRPKKRRRHPESWKRNLTKAKRAKGEEYVSPATGKTVEAVKQGPPCTCKRKCYGKFTDMELKRIFSCFWELSDKSVQDAYLHGLIRVRKVERRRPRTSHCTPRAAAFIYVVRPLPLPPFLSSLPPSPSLPHPPSLLCPPPPSLSPPSVPLLPPTLPLPPFSLYRMWKCGISCFTHV